MTQTAAVFGEALFDLIEQADNTLTAHIGGSPFNVARSFCKQGIETAYLSPMSTDIYGERLHSYALEEGIKLVENNRSNKPTSLALVTTDQQGQPDYRLYRHHIADLDVNASTLLSSIPSSIKLFHTGSLALVPRMLDVLIPCFTELKKRQVVISIDINMRKGVEENNQKYIDAVLQLLPYADIVKVSDEDLGLLNINLPALDGAKHILSMLQNGLVLLTEGGDGATALSKSIQISKPVFKPKAFADAVGAGDTFFSAFLAGLLRNNTIDASNRSEKDIDNALTFALMAATLNVEKHGCQPPTQAEVLEALEGAGQLLKNCLILW